MEQDVSEHEHDSVETEENAAEPTLEDQYGEPNDDSDDDLGLDDHVADGSSRELSEAEGDEDPADDAEDSEDSDDDPLEAFRRELWAKPGDWFVVHTYSGMENRVKSNLENR